MQRVWYKWVRDAFAHPASPSVILLHAAPVTPGLTRVKRTGEVIRYNTAKPDTNQAPPSPR